MTEEAKPSQGTDRVPPVLVLLFAGWLVALPMAALQWLFATREAAVLGFVVVLVPLAGLVIAVIGRRKVASIVFGIALLLTMTAVGYAAAKTYRHVPNRPGGPVGCQAHSAGGSNDCPGG